MTVADEAAGWAEGQRRIKACRETRGEELTRVPEELGELVNLTSLDLAGNNIGDDGARALAGLVKLTSLNLSGNAIGDDGGAVAHCHGSGGREGRPRGHLLARRARLLRRGHEGARLSSRPGARTGPVRLRCLAWAATPQSCWSAP